MLLAVRVIPRSKRTVLEWDGEGLKAHLTAPPVDGAANEALIALLAERLEVPRRTIRIVRGGTSRYKTVEIPAITRETLEHKVERKPSTGRGSL
jgi:uncharacterized protein (TIGR00251 family)